MSKISVQIIAKETTKFGELMFRSCLESLLGLPDELIIIDNGCSEKVQQMISEMVAKHATRIPATCFVVNGQKTFSELRNRALKHTTVKDYVYWIDTDEVIFPDNFRSLRTFLDANEEVVEVRQQMVHFMIDPFHYQDIIPKDVVHKWTESLKWEGDVHEVLVGKANGKRMNLPYRYLHFGYCRRQWQRCLLWFYYEIISKGNVNAYREYNDNGKIKDYFVDWRTPDTILDDRESVCKKYEGKYPEACTPWLMKWARTKQKWQDWLVSIDSEAEKFWKWWKQLRGKKKDWKSTLGEVCKKMEWGENKEVTK
jgi:glycosyltransferase involved in cell wall biosynthesis